MALRVEWKRRMSHALPESNPQSVGHPGGFYELKAAPPAQMIGLPGSGSYGVTD